MNGAHSMIRTNPSSGLPGASFSDSRLNADDNASNPEPRSSRA